MSDWYLLINGQQLGPFDRHDAAARAAEHPEALAWRPGFANWVPAARLDELSHGPVQLPPPPPSGGRSQAHEIDFQIVGSEMQYVEIELDPGESAISEAGSMMYKDKSVGMATLFGDGSESGLMGKLFGAGKRLITGESLFTTVFTHEGSGKAHVAFAAPYPGNVIPVDLQQLGGTLICQKDAFLAAAKGVSIGIHFQKRVLTALFGGEGFIMQKLEGDGLVFLHAGGTVTCRELKTGEELHVDTGCLVAMDPSVDFDLVTVGGIKSMIFGGEGVFLARLRGPGTVWLQSLPFSRLAGRMMAAAVKPGGKDEGSLLGNLLMGDRS
ncbi:MAG: TIGR00266 family protein [Gammaproteobacteria bacterium]|nr:TIGR00266 family protein [Gammaproteobacteria bacterium]